MEKEALLKSICDSKKKLISDLSLSLDIKSEWLYEKATQFQAKETVFH